MNTGPENAALVQCVERGNASVCLDVLNGVDTERQREILAKAEAFPKLLAVIPFSSMKSPVIRDEIVGSIWWVQVLSS